jgi:hypothetical protein
VANPNDFGLLRNQPSTWRWRAGEKTDLSAKEADRTSKLHARLKAWRESVGAQLPTANPDHNPEKDKPAPKKKN